MTEWRGGSGDAAGGGPAMGKETRRKQMGLCPYAATSQKNK